MDYQKYFERAKAASRVFATLRPEKINAILLDTAVALLKASAIIVAENAKDLAKIPPTDPKYDRLKLNPQRIETIANDIKNIAALPSPIGEIIENRTLANQLQLQKMRVPLGVVGVIYEARPNVTADVFSLCFKTANVALLKGGSDAQCSNMAITKAIQQVLAQHGISTDLIILLPPERAATQALLKATGFVDVLIPRGSQSLIDFVRQNSKVPVIETGAGIVHTYFDQSGDLLKGKAIIANAKTRRVSVCNALDCLLIHQSRLADLPALLSPLAEKQVELFADAIAFNVLAEHYPQNLLHLATEAHFGTEFLALKLAVKMVSGVDEALNHIAKYSSKHSEAIISEDEPTVARFLHEVDAAAVYANASTAFTDGAQFGLGAEIGISTQKLHARGPMGLAELSSYKWIIKGSGQIRT